MSADEKDIQQIYTDYYPRIVAYLRRIVGDLDAEDAAQETFVKAGRALDSFRGESSLSTWIYRIATNTARDTLRRPGRAQDGLPDDTEADVPADDVPPIDQLLIRRDMNECIRGLVDDLPGNYRTVLTLSDLEGFTNAEIAAILGLSLDTVKIRLHRARLRLRKSMDEACSLYRNEHNEFSCDRKPAALAFRKK
jgi:RNA polymerase sigma-70 factor (ECF subfamily)